MSTIYVNLEQKQHINLSLYAWHIIDEDMELFQSDNHKITLSGFLNSIFSNSYQTSDASISTRVTKTIKHSLDLIKQSRIQLPQQEETKLKKYLVSYYSNYYLNQQTYIKGEGRKFRINNENFQLLSELEDIEKYEGSIGLYLKAIFESYARLPFYQREKVYFKDLVDVIEQAILRQKELVVELTNSHRFRVSPYCIQPDKLFTYQYLVGYGERISNYDTSRNHVTFRLSRIKRIRMNISRSGRISKDESNQLDQLLIQYGPQFLSVQPAQIVVSFTKTGIQKYQNQLFMRPPISEIVNENTYRFDCSETQAYYYFFKFGKDAKILEPLQLRNRFVHEYLSAINTYK